MAATTSEQWFDEYLAVNGYDFDVEPDLAIATRPDRLIRRVGTEAICEIKEFTTDAMRRRWPEGGSRLGSFSTDEWLLNVRRAISEAARQLEPLSNDPRSLVIVVANPHGVIAEIEGEMLIEAMYGDLTVTFQLDVETGAPASEPEWVLGAGGRLADEQGPWVSAVVGLHRGDRGQDWERVWIEAWKAENQSEKPRTYEEALAVTQAYTSELEEARKRKDPPSGQYFWLDVVETISEEAVPLPRNILDAHLDRRWIVNRAKSRYELLS